MIIPKRRLEDCLQAQDIREFGDFVSLDCIMDCSRCGFHKPVAEARRRRIKAGEWSYKNGIRYLYVGKEKKC